MRMKNGVFSEYKIFAGNSNPELAEEIARDYGQAAGQVYGKQIQRRRDFREPLGKVSAARMSISSSLPAILQMTISWNSSHHGGRDEEASASRINAVILLRLRQTGPKSEVETLLQRS